ncbi:methylenetetrahydrofolate reductase [Saccharopolyspora phatthalungensis]|uniref:methylenetetrahydrofolate reductase n=1 Tax=Saccharopolyspora phatthalungensis TaxID=664693 RepID=UPI0028A6B75B|nr:methylenetetrahydrofolate reductase [Saccharopolyspora phatthalungensis]
MVGKISERLLKQLWRHHDVVGDPGSKSLSELIKGCRPQLSGAPFPPHLAERFAAVADDPAAVRALGIERAILLSQRLLAEGVLGPHFITFNFARATTEVVAELALPTSCPRSRAGCGWKAPSWWHSPPTTTKTWPANAVRPARRPPKPCAAQPARPAQLIRR